MSLYVTQCPNNKEILESYMGHYNVNAYGRPCYSYYKDSKYDTSVVDPEIAFQVCKPSIKYNTTCNNKCSAQLRVISSFYG